MSLCYAAFCLLYPGKLFPFFIHPGSDSVPFYMANNMNRTVQIFAFIFSGVYKESQLQSYQKSAPEGLACVALACKKRT
jgi:hypothetical protein